MKAIKNFMKKPITWGDSFKWSGIVLGLYAAVIGTIAAYEKWIAYKDKAERLDKYNSFRDMNNQIWKITPSYLFENDISEVERYGGPHAAPLKYYAP